MKMQNESCRDLRKNSKFAPYKSKKTLFSAMLKMLTVDLENFAFHSLLKKLGAAVIREIRKRQPVYIYYVKLMNGEQLLNCYCQNMKCPNMRYCG